MAVKLNQENVKLFSKFPWQYSIIALLVGVCSLFGVIIKNNADEKQYQNERIEYLRTYIKNSESDKAVWLKEQSFKSDTEIRRQQILIDSLQKLLLTRSDKSYQELKDILDIKGKDAVITIKPKNK